MSIFNSLRQRIFFQRYILRHHSQQLDRIESAIREYQGAFTYLTAAGVVKSDNAKDLAYFFQLNKRDAKGQVLQDLWALWETRVKTGGFFVEFGATDGVSLSNCYLLEEKYGWKGILAEPLTTWHPKLKKRKAIIDTRCVWKVSKQKLAFIASDEPEYSGLATSAKDFNDERRKTAKRTEVETVSLGDLLREHNAPKVIDFLSIDTEGSEYDILSNFDFESFRFQLIAVEHNFTENRQKIYDLLSGKGYIRVFEEFSEWDDWYVHKSLRTA